MGEAVLSVSGHCTVVLLIFMNPPNDILSADMQIAAARFLRWMPGSMRVHGDQLIIEGWALGLWDMPSRVLINGLDAVDVTWRIASPDMLAKFGAVPNADASRFFARFPLPQGQTLFPDGFVRVNVTGTFGEHRLSYRTAWYLADPALESQVPTPARIARVIGAPDVHAFQLGGATIVKRFEQLLLERFERPMSSFDSILDWGCGAGRLTRYLAMLAPDVIGADIDADNIQACREMLPKGRFEHVSLRPPCSLPADTFDLVVGVSVLTHLGQEMESEWLVELHRLTRPGALLLLSVQGLAQMALYDAPTSQKIEMHQRGFVDQGINSQLKDVVADQEYYRNILHSPDYIMTHWSRYFDVLDIIEGMAGNQDLVILRRR